MYYRENARGQLMYTQVGSLEIRTPLFATLINTNSQRKDSNMLEDTKKTKKNTEITKKKRKKEKKLD